MKTAKLLSSSVFAHTNGNAIASLILGLLSIVFALIAAIPAFLLGYLALAEIKNAKAHQKGRGLAVAGLCLGMLGLLTTVVYAVMLAPVVQGAMQRVRTPEKTPRDVTFDKMQRLGIALHNYGDTLAQGKTHDMAIPSSGSPTPSDNVESNAGLSWRVHLLPYFEERLLYEKFHLDEPWDSPHNRQLISQMPDYFRAPNSTTDNFKTVYLGVYGPRSAFWREPTKLTIITDGLANTATMVEVDEEHSVIWTKPEDWRFDPKNPRAGLADRESQFIFLLADRRVAVTPRDISDRNLVRLHTRDDGDSSPPQPQLTPVRSGN